MSTSSAPPEGFPRELLEQPTSVRLHYFQTKIVAHQRLSGAYYDLLHAIRYPAGASLIFVYGPTGVGKTTLRLRVEKQLIEDAAADPTSNPGFIPVAGIDAAAIGGRKFEWKYYCQRGLEALDEPFLEDKITYTIRGIHRDDQGRLLIERTVSTADLWNVLIKCLLHRCLWAFLIDEAQHIKKVSGGQLFLDQMDAIKSLATTSKTLHVLFGNYELLRLRNQSGQLSRRARDIHLPRYYDSNDEDIQEFVKVLLTFQCHLPLIEQPDLVSHYDYFYDQSLGCIGILKDWLHRCLAAALEEETPILTAKIWEKQILTPGQMAGIIQEILDGEKLFANEATTMQNLQKKLKYTSTHPATPPDTSAPKPKDAPSVEGEQSEQVLPAPLEQPQKRGRRPVQRAPKRDKVGKEQQRAEGEPATL